MKTIILIPARMHSTRLPGKPLADIRGAPMIVHVWKRAMEAEIAEVVVACDHPDIASAITTQGGRAILTDPELPTGSDRIWAALQKVEKAPYVYDYIINVQGDLPTLDPKLIRACLEPLQNTDVDIATLAARIEDQEERIDPHVVKVALSLKPGDKIGRALYFSRCEFPWGEGDFYHHIGLYAYKRAALERFVGLEPAPLEQRERLEQLRALEAGMKIGVSVVKTVPLGVDTPQDLEKARTLLS